ncbi:MAG: chlorite dismutase [Chloroflexi bacterium]|nr:MAG: chlorite dismutase [Chloroflexota bacterium]TMF81270.1 MAG: chlorite dismutase [Chloroflexota bacterium]TMG12553.1 MAG: chlorite dismutase [Chloroflexota bacterium]
MEPMLVSFLGGDRGQWSVDRMLTVIGAGLQPVQRVAILEGSDGVHVASHTTWVLRGVTSHDRYVAAEERTALAAHRAPLGRPSATAAALIPIRKKSVWWELPQDERRAIFEERSHHIARSLTYLPQIARRLHHGRDLLEPFDFLTWFEFAPRDMAAFDELVGILRSTEEWTYVEREVDIRLTRAS